MGPGLFRNMPPGPSRECANPRPTGVVNHRAVRHDRAHCAASAAPRQAGPAVGHRHGQRQPAAKPGAGGPMPATRTEGHRRGWSFG